MATTQHERICPNCAMPQRQWKGNQGEGYTRDGYTYCCQECAEGKGCGCGV